MLCCPGLWVAHDRGRGSVSPRPHQKLSAWAVLSKGTVNSAQLGVAGERRFWNCSVQTRHRETLWKCRCWLSRSGLGLRVCTSPWVADAGGPQTRLGVGGCGAWVGRRRKGRAQWHSCLWLLAEEAPDSGIPGESAHCFWPQFPDLSSGTTEPTWSTFYLLVMPGGGRGNPLQYSCLENAMDRGAWQATVRGVAESWMQLSHSLFFLGTKICISFGAGRVGKSGRQDW